MKNTYFVTFSLICFLISLTQIIFYDAPEYREHTYGWHAFVFGWCGIFNGSPISISWFANPTLIISWLTTRKLYVSNTFSILSLFFCSFFYIYDAIKNEVERPYYIGCYLWTSSILIMFLCNLYLVRMKTKEPA